MGQKVAKGQKDRGGGSTVDPLSEAERDQPTAKHPDTTTRVARSSHTILRDSDLRHVDALAQFESMAAVDYEKFGLRREPDPVFSFFQQAEKDFKLYNSIKKAASTRKTDGESYVFIDAFSENYILKSVFHYRYLPEVTAPNDLTSCLRLPAIPNLSDRRASLFELFDLLDAYYSSKKGEVRNIKIKEMSNTSLNNNELDAGFKRATLVIPDGQSQLQRQRSRSSVRGSKIYNLLAKTEEVEKDQDNLLSNLSNHLIVSMRQMRARGLTLHDKKYDLTSPLVSAFNAVNIATPKHSQRNGINIMLFSQTKLSQIDMPAGGADRPSGAPTKAGLSGGIRENFHITSKILHGRVILVIQKKMKPRVEQPPAEEDQTTLSCPEMISLDCKSLEEIPFRFSDAQYFDIKGLKEAFYYFRVTCTSSS